MRVDNLVFLFLVECIFVSNDLSLLRLLMILLLIVCYHALWVWVLHKSVSATGPSSYRLASLRIYEVFSRISIQAPEKLLVKV